MYVIRSVVAMPALPKYRVDSSLLRRLLTSLGSLLFPLESLHSASVRRCGAASASTRALASHTHQIHQENSSFCKIRYISPFYEIAAEFLQRRLKSRTHRSNSTIRMKERILSNSFTQCSRCMNAIFKQVT